MILFLLLMAAGLLWFQREAVACAEEPAHDTDPDAVCARCHEQIYEQYRKTPMAQASGRAVNGVIPADFRHQASGIHYRVYEESGRVWMSYEREGGLAGRELKGRQELRFFLGSGRRGRTYLFEQEGYWFEAPINWYSKKQMWDMTPNHLADREMPLTLPVDPGCLHCHASGVASSLPDARNHYAGEPFAYGGIRCAACHGDGTAHTASEGKVAMLKLEALEPARRDSVCLNCHLEGQIAVDREGKKAEDFKPGEKLFDSTEFFVYRGEAGPGGRATSQWEALLKSECKKKSGDRMTCTTCHDPHGTQSGTKGVAFYRQRCLSCHDQARFAAGHHAENPDCTACHMARARASDIAHEQITDHRIRKRIEPEPEPAGGARVLEAVPGSLADDRALGLAYAQIAAGGDREALARATALLKQSEEAEKGAAGDAKLHTELGFLEQVSGHTEAARVEYEQAIKANRYDSVALGDLGLIEAAEHYYAEAIDLWKTAFEHDPVQIGAGLNLAIVACKTGNRKEALDVLQRVLKFAPDDAKAVGLAAEIRSGKEACAGK